MSAALTQFEFIRAVAFRFVERSDMTFDDALPYARDVVREYLAEEGLEYGAPDHDWTPAGAITVADEDLACWS